MRKLKIFTDKSFLREGSRYISLLYPFWGDCDVNQGNIDYGRFSDYSKIGEQLFELASIEDADAAILPNEWCPEKGGDELARLMQKSREYHKPLIVFFNSDSAEEIDIPDSVVFRTSFYSATRRHNEYAVPGWSRDFLKDYLQGELRLRVKKSIPVVSYAGYVDYNSAFTYAKNVIRKIIHAGDPNRGRPLRGEALRRLKLSQKIETNFIMRDSNIPGYSSESLRKEYVRNIIDSDYSLVVRGMGNFSYRLYEVLSCGRIPLFVNTDCVLPFDHLIDWKKYVIWVESYNLQSVARAVSDYHEAISETDFVQMQKECRKLYEEWISPIGFYSNIWRCVPRLGAEKIQCI